MNLILASRTYLPLADVERCVEPDSVTFGATAIALRAEMLGAKRLPLEATRKTLLEYAAMDGARVTLFVARDPVTKLPTEGMAGIQSLLNDRGIPFEVVSSPFPGRVCAALTELRERAEKAMAATTEGRRAHWIAKVLESSKAVTDMRDEFNEKLRDGMPFRAGDDELDEKWIRWLHTYEALCDGLKNAEGVLA